MTIPSLSPSRSAVILKPNRLYADTLRHLAVRHLPRMRIQLAGSLADATAALENPSVELLLVGTEALPDGDLLDFLALRVCQHPALRVLVIAAQCDNRTLVALRALPIHSVFDATSDSPDRFSTALRTTAGGGAYWSPTLLDRLREFQAGNSVFRLLTKAEQLILSAIGDGSDDADAAHRLGLSPGTISSVRRNLHRKLGVQHRGELIRVAVQNGFVRFTFTGVERPGYQLFSDAHRPRPRSRAIRSAA